MQWKAFFIIFAPVFRPVLSGERICLFGFSNFWKMKRKTWYACAGGLLCALGLSFLSCTDEQYDLRDGVDLELMVGGDSLYLPLGSTENFTIKSLLGSDSELSELLRVREDGVYVLAPELNETRMQVETIGPESLQIEDVVSDTVIAVNPQAKSALPAQMDMNLDFLFTDIPESIKDLDFMSFSNQTFFEFQLKFPNLPEGFDVAQFKPEMEVTLPDIFVFPAGSMEENRFHITEFNTADGYTASWPLSELLLSEVSIVNQSMRFLASVSVDGVVDMESTAGLEALQMEVVCAVRQIDPYQVRGVFNPQIEAMSMEASFGAVPEALRADATCLDFADPYLLLTIKNPLEFLLSTEVELVPVMDGVRQEEMTQIVSTDIQPMSLQTAEGERFYIGANTGSTPSGYSFVEADVAGLLRHLPDMLLADIQVVTDTTKFYTYTFGNDYEVVAQIEPEIPLVFGDSLYVSFGDTIGDLPEGLSGNIADGELVIYGEMHNTYPLTFAIDIQALDKENRLLPLQTDGEQVVHAGQVGQEEVSTLEFRFSDPEGVLAESPIAAFKIECKALTTIEDGGGSVYETSYFRADLKLKKTGGIKVDLNSDKDE